MARSHRLPARAHQLILAVAGILLLAPASGCGTSDSGTTDPTGGVAADNVAGDGLFPDVVEATATRAEDGTWRFDVTLSSPYDTPDRYADAWRVVGPDCTEYGVRVLAHDHQNEQPFTRSLSGVAIPDDVSTVTIEGRDQRNGWGGDSLDVPLP